MDIEDEHIPNNLVTNLCVIVNPKLKGYNILLIDTCTNGADQA